MPSDVTFTAGNARQRVGQFRMRFEHGADKLDQLFIHKYYLSHPEAKKNQFLLSLDR